jgi:hypothetical protein
LFNAGAKSKKNQLPSVERIQTSHQNQSKKQELKDSKKIRFSLFFKQTLCWKNIKASAVFERCLQYQIL